jgi:hypothetical protein
MRVFAVAVLAYAAFAGANALGYPWLGYVGALILFAIYMAISLVQRRGLSQRQREARWEKAVYSPKLRPRAIAEVKKARRSLEPPRPEHRTRHARLSVLLAELLDAQGECEEAAQVSDAVPLDALASLDQGLVRHTRAVTHLRANDAAGALRALEGRQPSGDAELDQRLALLEAYARIERGEIKQGLQQADAIERLEDADESVLTEARVVRAAGLDALGKREEALVALAALGRDSLSPLSELGHPRVRALAKQILEGVSEEKPRL